jgi:glutamate synthase (NADPH/NADH) small chain
LTGGPARAEPKGLVAAARRTKPAGPAEIGLRDWREICAGLTTGQLAAQGGRCMDCGVPFCHAGCPLGNLIPEWNDPVRQREGREAAERPRATWAAVADHVGDRGGR